MGVLELWTSLNLAEVDEAVTCDVPMLTSIPTVDEK